MKEGLRTGILMMGVLLFACCAEDGVMERIRHRKEITVLTRNNAHCYYVYRDIPCGFEYELARAFSEHLGVRLVVKTPAWKGIVTSLESETGDFVAASLSISPSRERQMDFSNGYMTVQQQVVVHKSNYQIECVDDLAGKTVHVRAGTAYEERLKELRDQGIDLLISLHEDVPTEEFIRMVSEREIEITIADSHIAMLNRRYYPDIRTAFSVDEPQPLGWAVKKGEKALRDEINRFFDKIRRDGTFARIRDAYYADAELFDYVDLKKFHKRLKTRLPEYKDIIIRAADAHGFDWRLIAAVIYQESHFDPKAMSHTGAEGLMQLTPVTAEEMGITDRTDPEQSILGGVRYLKTLYDRFDGIPNPDRFLMALASYNVGHGHVMDARRIADEKEMDPDRWNSIEEVLPLLRYPVYYTKTQYGYCRGTEPVIYIKRIMTYYNILIRESMPRGVVVARQADTAFAKPFPL